MKHSDVTISIVTLNNLEGVQKTLSAVLDTREGARLILTSNGNPDVAEYFGRIASQRDNVSVCQNAFNRGFIEPNNRAFESCDTPYFVTLNDDAIPSAEWLNLMKEAMKPDDVAIAGPGGRWLDDTFVGHRMSERWPHADFIEGSCMMVKVGALRAEVEPLFWSELKWGYCEDADLCLRMVERGYSIAVTPFELLHKAGTTTRTVADLHPEMKRNFKLCMNKWATYLKTRRFD